MTRRPFQIMCLVVIFLLHWSDCVHSLAVYPSGVIPESLGKLSCLTYMNLCGNKLIGEPRY